MAHKVQTYANHRRFQPLYHYVAMPILVANVGFEIAYTLRNPTWFSAWRVLFAVGLVIGLLVSRGMVLVVQNRLIGLEMRLRLLAMLPPDQRTRISELRLGQLIALRFAGDAELPALVERCLSGQLVKPDDIKREIRDWRPDFVRA